MLSSDVAARVSGVARHWLASGAFLCEQHNMVEAFWPSNLEYLIIHWIVYVTPAVGRQDEPNDGHED